MIPTTTSKKPNLQYFWAIVLLVIVFSILLKLPTFNLKHHEGDEIRLWYLAKNWATTDHYTLQGSPLFNLFPHYEPYYAHRKMPVHPPLFPALLRPFIPYEFAHYENIPQTSNIAVIEAIYNRTAPHYAVIASWIGHLLAILAVALIGRYLLLYHKISLSALSPLFWLPLLGIATDPVMTWVSTKIWIDNLHAGLAALSVAFAMMANSSRYSQTMYFLSGIWLGLALLSKITAAIIIPVIIFIIFVHETDTKKRIQALIWGSMPALVLSLPWYIPRYLPQLMIEKIPVGRILENSPINEYRGMCEFCGTANSRPFYYFIVKLPLIAPLVLIGVSFYVTLFFTYVRKLAVVENLRFFVPVIWFLFVLFAVTFYLSFYGAFIMRRITLLLPSLYVMFFMLIIYSEKFRPLRKYQPLLLFLGSLGVVYGAISGGYYLLLGNGLAEFFSLIELAGIVKLW